MTKQGNSDKMNDKEFLTVADIQQLLHVGKNKAYSIVNLSCFPKIKIGKQYYIPQKDFIKWLDCNINKKIV